MVIFGEILLLKVLKLRNEVICMELHPQRMATIARLLAFLFLLLLIIL
jgi:hypothetical protein